MTMSPHHLQIPQSVGGSIVRIEALLHDLRARSTLRSALKAHPGDSTGPVLHFAETWSDLLKCMGDGLLDLAVVDPWDERTDSSAHRNLGLLLDGLEESRVVLYVSPSTYDPGTLAEITRAGFSSLLIAGVDDDPGAVRQVIGSASAQLFLGSVASRLKGHLEPPRWEFLVCALAASIRSRGVDDLAYDVGMSARNLRTRAHELGLPSPRHLLRWGRVCHAAGLQGIGVRSTARVAFYIGYGDPASLCRLFREVLGCTAREFRESKMDKLVTEGILDRLAGVEEEEHPTAQEP